jgi:uncharacterized protein (TIGR00369 family)
MTTAATSHPWHADMVRLRARTQKPGLVDPAFARTPSGLAFLQQIVRGEIVDPPIAHTLDFFLLEAESGRAVFQGEPGFAHYNPIATVHGGWHGTLLDSAMACAAQTLCEPGRAYTTLEYKIHCVRPLTEKTGPVRAEGKVVASGRRMATAEGRLFDADGKLYSHGTTTCMFLDPATP